MKYAFYLASEYLNVRFCRSYNKTDYKSCYQKKGKAFFGDITELKDLEPKSGPEEDAAAMKAFQENLYGRDNTYYRAGDTAVCVLDSFDWIDYEGWKTYFAGGGELPKHDSFAIVVDAMNKAKADPTVRHFVLDLTENRGGSNDVLMGIMGLWLNKSEYTVERCGRSEANHKICGGSGSERNI